MTFASSRVQAKKLAIHDPNIMSSCTRCQSQLHTKKNSARSLLTKQKCQKISSLVAFLKMKIVIDSHSFTIFSWKKGNQSHLTPKLWDPKNLSQVPDRKCSCSRLTPGSSAMEFMAEVASKKGRGGGFLNPQNYVNIYTYWTFSENPMSMLVVFFPSGLSFLMWHGCHSYVRC